MNNAFLLTLDTLSFREWAELTSNTKKCIDFCQQLGLIGYTLNEGCAQDHKNWKLGVSSRATDGWVWRCGKYKSTRTIRVLFVLFKKNILSSFFSIKLSYNSSRHLLSLYSN